MKAKDFVGIIPPVLSSFTSEGRVYEKGIREIIRFTLPHVNGYYPIGTYGCGPLMSIDERKRALEIILEEVNGKVPVVARWNRRYTNYRGTCKACQGGWCAGSWSDISILFTSPT